jgi:GT2 family glycosyltransferase
MKIHLIVIAHSLPQDTEALLNVEPVGEHTFKWHLFLHSPYPDVIKVCERAAKRKNVTYYPYGTNRGLAKSWNEGILAGYGDGADVVIVINDDMLPAPGDIEKVAEAAMKVRETDPLVAVVDALMYDKREDKSMSAKFGFFAINPVAIETIGMFDEQFFPIYWEDVDYGYRMHISGLRKHTVEDTGIVHKGSANIYANENLLKQNELTITANRSYYKIKWGGDKGRERYTQPFDDLRFSTRIAPCDRERPYWGYERTDQKIVRF